jgi:hypothetical protein
LCFSRTFTLRPHLLLTLIQVRLLDQLLFFHAPATDSTFITLTSHFDAQRSYVMSHCLLPPDIRVFFGMALLTQTRMTYTLFFLKNFVTLPFA